MENLDSLVSKVDVLAHDVENLKIRTTPNQDKHTESLNAISLQINENERMMALLKARWAREAEEARIAEMNRKTVKVYTIQTTKEDPPSLFKDDEIDFDNCNLTEVFKFLQKLAKTSDASKISKRGTVNSIFKRMPRPFLMRTGCGSI